MILFHYVSGAGNGVCFSGPSDACVSAVVSGYSFCCHQGRYRIPADIVSGMHHFAIFILSLISLRHISAFTANLTINLEPVYGILLAICCSFTSRMNYSRVFIWVQESSWSLFFTCLYPIQAKEKQLVGDPKNGAFACILQHFKFCLIGDSLLCLKLNQKMW